MQGKVGEGKERRKEPGQGPSLPAEGLRDPWQEAFPDRGEEVSPTAPAPGRGAAAVRVQPVGNALVFSGIWMKETKSITLGPEIRGTWNHWLEKDPSR